MINERPFDAEFCPQCYQYYDKTENGVQSCRACFGYGYRVPGVWFAPDVDVEIAMANKGKLPQHV